LPIPCAIKLSAAARSSACYQEIDMSISAIGIVFQEMKSESELKSGCNHLKKGPELTIF
jgi:hypothetical protein